MIPCYQGNQESPWPSDEVVLHAGSLHGITVGSIFEIFKSDSPNPNVKDLLTTLTVSEVKQSISRFRLGSSDANVFNTLNSGIHARLRKASEDSPLYIYCNDLVTLKQILADTPESWLTVHIEPVESLDAADICLTVKANFVHFSQGKRARTGIKFSYFPPYTPCPVHAMPDIRDFINRYAHFTSRLIMKSPADITDFVDIKMNKLRPDNKGGLEVDSEVTPATINDSEFFEIVVDTAQHPDPYGFTIHHKGGVDLYAYLLYFDPSKLTIGIFNYDTSSFSKLTSLCVTQILGTTRRKAPLIHAFRKISHLRSVMDEPS